MPAARLPGPSGLGPDPLAGGTPAGLLRRGGAPGPEGANHPLEAMHDEGIDRRDHDRVVEVDLSAASRSIAWGASPNVSPEFKAKVIRIAKELEVEPDHLMACMAFESGETFSPSVKNAAGSGAVGLIQFMPSTAEGLGTSTTALAAMTAVEQLDWVRNYFIDYKGKLTTLDDMYMVILWPAAVGKPDGHVLFDKADAAHPKRYQQNKGLDADGDGKVTKSEAAAAVRAKLTKGLGPKYAG